MEFFKINIFCRYHLVGIVKYEHCRLIVYYCIQTKKRLVFLENQISCAAWKQPNLVRCVEATCPSVVKFLCLLNERIILAE